jgi:hypothetical protein
MPTTPTPYQKSIYAHKDLVKESLHDMALEPYQSAPNGSRVSRERG